MDGKRQRFDCDKCDMTFSTLQNMKRHFKRVHEKVIIREEFRCSLCKKRFINLASLRAHWPRHSPSTRFQERQSAFRRNCISFRRVHSSSVNSVPQAFLDIKEDIFRLVEHELLLKRGLKASIIIMCTYLQFGEDETTPLNYMDVALRAPAHTLYHASKIRNFIRSSQVDIQQRSDDLEASGSNWVLDRCLFSDLEIGKCGRLAAGCWNQRVAVTYLNELYSAPVNATSEIEERSDCFLSSLSYHFMRTSDQAKLDEFVRLNVNVCIPMPASVDKISKFELHNAQLGVRFNILHVVDRTVYPVYTSTNYQFKEVVNLALFESEDENDRDNFRRHYAYIIKLDSFLREKYPSRDKNGKKKWVFRQNKYHCVSCLSHFSSKKILTAHEQFCRQNEPVRITLPLEHETVKFRAHQNSVPVGIFGVCIF